MVIGYGLIQPSQNLECKPKVVVGFSVIWLDGEGFTLAGYGLIQPLQILERIAEVAVCLSVFGLDS